MVIKLYVNKSAENVSKKDLKEEKIYDECRYLDDTSAVNPTFVLKVDKMIDMEKYNYCVVPSLSRRYFITDKIYHHGRISLVCHCDVLSTYRDSYINTSQLIARQEHKRNKMLIDSQIPIHCDNSYEWGFIGNQMINTGTGGVYGGGTYILKTVGGV